MERPTFTIKDFYRSAKALTGILKALKNPNGLNIAQKWDVLLTVAKDLRKLADQIEGDVTKAIALEEYERNGG